MNGRCDIIIPVWNQLAVTRECVASIKTHTRYPYRLILIDNASDAETEAYLKEVAADTAMQVLLIRNSANLGFVKAVNQGMAASDAYYQCIMNNDTIATGGWLEELIRIMDRDRQIGLLNPSSNTSGQFPADGQTIDEYAATLAPLAGQVQELYTCRGFCMVVRREVVRDLGFLDETYHMGYFDDTDYCKRAQLKGYRTARAKSSYVYHKENTSFKALSENKKLFEDNERLFFGRWGRPVKVAYFADRKDDGKRIDELAIGVARSGHQMNIFLKRGLPWPVTLDHFDIRRFDLAPVIYAPLAAYKIVKRKKKKKLDILVTDDPRFGSFLRHLAPWHEAEVLVRPDMKVLAETLAQKTREF